MEEILGHWQFFLLVLVRMTGLFTLSPVYGRSNIPVPLKVGFTLLLTFIMVQLVPPVILPQFDSIFSYMLLVLSELLVGLTLGFVTTLFFSVVFTAGQMIDTQIGFGMVQVYDVQTNVPIPVAGSLLNLVLLQCFLAVDGHTRLVAILFDTFAAAPVGQVVFRPELAMAMVKYFSQCFILAVNVAMPILASGLLAEAALGIIVRSAPQMNVFVVGIPIKIILGLLLLAVTVPVFATFTSTLFDRMYEAIRTVFGGMVPT